MWRADNADRGRAPAALCDPAGGGCADALVAWLAERLEIPAAAFVEYAGRAQTMTDRARFLAAALGLRPATAADLPFMIEAAAQSAWSTDRGQPIAAGVIAALRTEKVILPAPAVIERAAIAGRRTARGRFGNPDCQARPAAGRRSGAEGNAIRLA